MAHAKAPFKTVVDWWDELCGKSGVDLYIGIGVYNGENPNSAFADSSEAVSYTHLDVYKRQVKEGC